MVDIKVFDLPFNGRTVQATELSESQLVALSLTTKKGDVTRTIGRILRVLEASVGPDEWAAMDEELLTGKVDLAELTSLFTAITEATVANRKNAPAEDDIDDELAQAEARLAELRGMKTGA